MNLVIDEVFRLSDLAPNQRTVDLGAIESIDAFGIVCVLCFIQARAAIEPQRLILVQGKVLQRLADAHFFVELKRRCPDRITWNPAEVPAAIHGALIPVSYAKVGGDERRIAEEIRQRLAHAFSDDLLSAGAVIMGRAANSHTHAKSPCHIMATGLVADPRHLCIGIGDLGDGIQPASASG